MSLIGLLTATEKTSPLRATTHETHTVAPKEQLEGPRITRKGDTCPQVPPPSSELVAGGKQCATRSTITPSKTWSANFYRHIKRRVGRSLRRAHCKGNLVPSREQATHKPLRAKSCIYSSKTVLNPRLQQDSVGSYRQHNSGCLYQQRGGMKSGSLCALLWRILSWCTRQQVTLKARHIPGRLNVIADKLSRLGQTIQTSSKSVPSNLLPVASTQGGLVCHQIQQQTATVCLTGPRPPGMRSGCTHPILGGSGPIRLPTSSHLGQSGGEAPGLPLQQNNSDCPRVAQHALVLGSSGNVKPDTYVSA